MWIFCFQHFTQARDRIAWSWPYTDYISGGFRRTRWNLLHGLPCWNSPTWHPSTVKSKKQGENLSNQMQLLFWNSEYNSYSWRFLHLRCAVWMEELIWFFRLIYRLKQKKKVYGQSYRLPLSWTLLLWHVKNNKKKKTLFSVCFA